jgi:uncharacterized protein YecE (DUF72 family)
MIFIGTSGYQYKEWRGSFYPEKLSEAKMLAFYAEQFSTVEINYTFNRVPTEAVLAKWQEQTPDTFKFTLKAHRRLTHSKVLDTELLQLFVERANVLGAKLGVLLFQFPPTLKKDFNYITRLIEELPEGTRAAFEFRHTSWFEDDLYQRLRARNLALCIAESESLSTPVVSTADYGYLRLRMENYSSKDIGAWANKIRAMADWKDTFVYFKHEDAGTGPKFVRQLMQYLNPQENTPKRKKSEPRLFE